MAETRQLNIRISLPLYQALEAFAHQERRSVSQTVRQSFYGGISDRWISP
ncbi:hypothetical protein [Candidatus Entotheonella palauensis]|uniref:Uncharacterized protein n=1 Tax=Candidatus Entotheonella gemina TaxID=1429439 RepID=W4LZM7_9BACT|nr:hypothetical protein [Candidatus Entotheonella palauensis]ETX03554.1 MAG: hypothetical protein ETSY2_33115 [Candidatus Entotheonella gemina]